MKKILKWAGFGLIPIFVLLLIAFLYRVPVSYFVLKNVAQFYAGRAHIALEIGRIDGRPLSETTIANLTFRPAAGQPQDFDFAAQAITCSYNLRDLKEGLELFLQGLHCAATDPVFAYDFKLVPQQDQPDAKPAAFNIPALLPKLDLHNGTVILTDSGWGAAVHGIDSSLGSSPDGAHELQIRAGDFTFRQEDVTRIDTGFRALLRYKDARLSIASLDLGQQEISASGFIDLARIDQGSTGFAADIAFGQSRLNMEGSIENKLFRAHVRTDKFDSAELQKRLGGSGWDIAGRIRGEADLAYNLESKKDLNGSFTLDVQEGKLHGVGIETFSLAGSFDAEIFNVSTAEARTTGNHVLVSEVSIPMPLLLEGEVFSIAGGSKAKFGVDIADFPLLLKLAPVEDNILPDGVRPNSLTIRGYLENGTIYLDGAHVVAVESSLTIDQAIIPIPTTVEEFASVPVKLTARYASRDLQSLAGLFADIHVSGQAAADMNITGTMKEPQADITLTSENLGYKDLQIGSLALQGHVQIMQEKLGLISSAQVTVTGLTQINPSGTLALLPPMNGTWQGDTFAMAGAFQLDGKGEVSTRISRAPGKEIAVEITTRNLDSDGWLGNFIDARFFFHGADIVAALKGIPDSTQLQLAGTISEAGGTEVPFPLSGSFGLQYSPKGINITEFTWRSLERNQLTITGYLPYDPMAIEPFLAGELTLKGHIDFPALEDIAVLLEPWGINKGSVAVDMDISGSWDQPEGHIHFQAESIEPPGTIRQFKDSAVDFSGDIAALGGVIVLQAANLDSTVYSAQATGSWRHGISVKELLQNRKAELTGIINADAKFTFKDLNFLRPKLPWLRRLEGDMQGELHVSGSVTDPDITGSFSFRDGEVSHIFNFPMLSAVNLQGEFDEHSITISNMRAEVGGSPVNFSGTLNRKDETTAVNLHVDGKNVLLFRNNDMQMRGDVNLDVSGPMTRLAVKGTTGLTGGSYTRNVDFLSKIGTSTAPVSQGGTFLFSFEEQPLKDAVFDIRITTIEPFRIRNNLVRGTLRPELSLKGTGELPFLIGAIYIDPSRVLLPSGRLQVQSGLVRFLESDPERPQLDLLANSKVLGYDINVVTQGPLDNPVITLSSSPALPNDELLLLLLTGKPPQQDVAGGARSSGTTNVMVYLGRDFLSKWLEDESGTGDESILDRFELDFGRGVTKSGEQTVEAAFRLSELEPGKRKVYYLTAEKDRYDAYNYGLKLVFRFE